MTRIPVRLCIIAAILVVAALLFWVIPPLVAERCTRVADVPFPLISGQRVSVTFRPMLTETYYIGVACERKLPFARLQQIIGPVVGALGAPKSRPQIDFQLESHGEEIHTKPSPAMFWGRTVGFDLASFSATRGQNYTLTANVVSAEPDLRVLNARVVIRLDPLTGKGFYLLVLFCDLVAFILVIVAVALTIISFFYGYREKRA